MISGTKCKLCRREGVKLFLKGDRCYTANCAVEKRSYAPGQHGLRKSKQSEYSIRLREKQKAKKIYGIREQQFRRYFALASKKSGASGTNLLQLLERRIDNVVFRSGLAPSRLLARQLVKHGHIKVQDKKVDIPSYLVKVGDIVSVAEKSKEFIKKYVDRSVELGRVASWLTLNQNEFKVNFDRLPDVEELNIPIQPQLIVEFYSR
jgi:small subunit ribosomal protein S4